MNDYIKNYLKIHQDWIINKEYNRLYDGIYQNDRKDLSEVLIKAGINFLPHLKDTIPAGCFSNNKQLTHIIIPPNINDIKRRAFDSSSIQSIQLPPLDYLGAHCFDGCKDLKSISIQGDIDTIPSYCFYNCTSLETVTLSYRIIDIKNNAFENCINLKHIDLPDTILFIGQRAFAGSGLESIRIPSTIMGVGNYVFRNCEELKEVIYDGTEEDLVDTCNDINSMFDNINKIKFTFLK